MLNQQEILAVTMLLRPLGLLVLLAAAYPVKWLIQHRMRDGKLKRLLLYRINAKNRSRNPGT